MSTARLRIPPIFLRCPGRSCCSCGVRSICPVWSLLSVCRAPRSGASAPCLELRRCQSICREPMCMTMRTLRCSMVCWNCRLAIGNRPNRHGARRARRAWDSCRIWCAWTHHAASWPRKSGLSGRLSLLEFSSVTGLSEPFLEDPEFRAFWEKKAPVGRLGLAEDVARAALFLASGEARFISGAGLHVDGGARVNF
ncbi:MAG: SDR family oxidoreductase [Gammaproteobacteria bacterium]|nr:SDR family oxidoreductase [Gammaproteobacteria bacterium]MBP6053455.1 SDR family oxidoreductase [Pseudomonadales bacterium]MBK7170547.1 SDR family oxidoreductase [Gammaproteobacteria bacterium]MBK7729349.1 SDR family oxidoreductase [Gammaproteobacteria bacterium]MBK8307616.1 SDR family oxidoreductase [Gammaproteobacteria bacterium]